MGGNKSKRPKPSYEEGELRDPSIKKMQDKAYQRKDLSRLVKKAASSRRPPPHREAGP